MRTQSIPELEHSLAAEVVAQLLEEADQADVVVGARAGLEVQPRPPAVPAVAERGRRRDPLPVEAMPDHRGAATRRPGLAERRGQGEAALVLEEDPAVLALGPLFSAGQVTFTQWSMAASSRSLARREGRCRLQPM